jgi:hypothetical protein
MLRAVIEEIERLHGATVAQSDGRCRAELEELLARCLRDLRPIAAQQARRRGEPRPWLRIV